MSVQLSSKQLEIVNADLYGSISVLASAGSGKTRVLTERIKFILEQQKKHGVIALTFTNKASEELSDRLSISEIDLTRIWTGTIHSVAQRILDQYGHTIGLPEGVQIYERDQDRMDVFLEALRRSGVNIDEYLDIEDSKEKRSRQRNLQNYMDGFSIIKREMLREEDVEQRLSDLKGIWIRYLDYQNALANSGGIDYDDIIKGALEVLLTQTWVGDLYRTKYGFICVDEAQDLNKIQYEFIKALAGPGSTKVMMVGDPSQMIYGFNGSSSTYLTHSFKVDFAPQTFKLEENYRSSRAVVQVARQLRPSGEVHQKYAFEGTVQFVEFETEEAEAAGICKQIEEILQFKQHAEIEGPISLASIAVIGRNRFVFRELEKQLNAKQIPYGLRLAERAKQPSSKFGRALDFALRVKLNPKDWINGKKLCELLEIQWVNGTEGSSPLASLRERFDNKGGSPDSLFSALLAEVDYLAFENPNILKFKSNFEKRIQELASQNNEEAKTLEFARSIEELIDFSNSWMRFRQLGLGTTLGGFRNADALGKLSHDTSDLGLTLGTVHTMKGLEKDIIFILGFSEGTFPDYRAISHAQVEEERNTAFVAVTRARRWLFISHPRNRLMPWGSSQFQRPSRFLLEMGLITHQ